MSDDGPRYETAAGYQQELVDYLLNRDKHTAVVKCDNSEVQAYLTRGYLCRTELSNIDGKQSPYRIDNVCPLPDSEVFTCRVDFTAPWTEVFDRD